MTFRHFLKLRPLWTDGMPPDAPYERNPFGHFTSGPEFY